MSEKTPRLNPKLYFPSIKKQKLSLKWVFGDKMTVKIFGIKIFEFKNKKNDKGGIF